MLCIKHSEVILGQIKSSESVHQITQMLLWNIAKVYQLLLIRRNDLRRKWRINSFLILLHLPLHLILLWQNNLLRLYRFMGLHVVLRVALICLVIQQSIALDGGNKFGWDSCSLFPSLSIIILIEIVLEILLNRGPSKLTQRGVLVGWAIFLEIFEIL